MTPATALARLTSLRAVMQADARRASLKADRSGSKWDAAEAKILTEDVAALTVAVNALVREAALTL